MALTLMDLLGVEPSRTGILDDCDRWLVCHVVGKPVAKGRPRARSRGGKVTLYTPDTTLKGEAWVRQCWMDQVGQVLLAGPLEVRLMIHNPIPKSWNLKQQALAHADEVRPVTKPDLDNVGKLALDALNGIAWFDDSQVVRMVTDKRFALPSLGTALWIAVREWEPANRDWLA